MLGTLALSLLVTSQLLLLEGLKKKSESANYPSGVWHSRFLALSLC